MSVRAQKPGANATTFTTPDRYIPTGAELLCSLTLILSLQIAPETSLQHVRFGFAMPKAFFSGWQIWEKLVFVRCGIPRLHNHVVADFSQCLACAMVVTLILGCFKLVYAHWRLRKFTAIAEQEKKDQVLQRAMSQRRSQSRADEILFGIRAIESGIEVEGVWISRDNTPEISPVPSARSSMQDRGISNAVELVDRSKLDMNQSASSSAFLIMNEKRSSINNKRPKERIRHSSPDHGVSRPARSKYPPVSYAKYGCNPYLVRHSMPASTLHGLDAIHRTSSSVRGEESNENSDSSHESTDSTGDTDTISASAPSLLAASSRTWHKAQSQTNLNLLDNHRSSQVAETGQLAPRGRRPGQRHSVDVPTTRVRHWHASSADYIGARPKLVPSKSDTAGVVGQISQPKIAALPPAVRRSSMPDVTPFAEFCKRAPQATPPRSPRSQSRDSTQTTATTTSSDSPVDSRQPSPTMPSSEGAAEMRLPNPKRMSFEKSTAQILRGHGTGFEILKPGSLDPTLPAEQPVEKHRAGPPISLQNTHRPTARSGSEESRNRLQKKRRPNVDSTTNSTASRHSRISMFA